MINKDLTKEDIAFSQGIIRNLNVYETRLGLSYCKGALDDKNMTFFATNFIGSAFVGFKYEHYKDYILYDYKQTIAEAEERSYMIKGERIKIEEASHPEDVKW